ncbi:hypothetical protein AXE80_06015 [Wenyingzhuangia fucanilytica]|uniref:Cytochrome c domain-containing protein n=1 Tax=Wenyingzhuangia fucanilytica TaxID=1790137 RepID=A0A1B1Y511_9FLAO|nr:DUF1553 domain-containing protein [Wenyingzhuangia fucanilytica]ANW95862.1 hypothetical protein AXE80_06015 [Wenyingzhuangia fucanilytica]
MEDINWVFQLLGRMHPLLVHFPVGLLVVALFLEILSFRDKKSELRGGIKWMVYLGALSAFFSAVFGWLLRTQENYSGSLVNNHQYTGIATTVLAVITAFVLRNTLNKKNKDLRLYRLMLMITVVVLSIAGHLGANLTHGEDYLTAVLPSKNNRYNDKKSEELLSDLKKTETLSELQLDKLNLEVRGIFAHKCYQCHSENKQKGELILEHKEGVFKGGKSGPSIVAGKPEQSEVYRRITLPAGHKKVMPTKGKLLTANEIALVKLWIQKGAHWSDKEVKVFPEAALALHKPTLPKVEEQNHPVDKLIDKYFDTHQLDWPNVVDDRTFIKRVYMDVIGLLPDPNAIQKFIQDETTNKREELIDFLLNDDKNYTQHWLSFWNDLLRNDYSGTGFITGGRKQITGWLYKSLINNHSYDQMVKELINPVKGSEGFIKGIQWRGVVNASQRTEMQAAQNIGQSLLGANVKCASCHNSFVSNMTLDQAYGFATIFSDSILELNRCDKPIGKMAKPNFLYPELGSVDDKTVKERLVKLSKVMVQRENGRLYRTLTNRFWDRLMGRGIIVPLDEMDNTPWNAELLDWLAADFVDSGSDLKHLLKQILTSKAYQLPVVNYQKIKEVKDNYVFKGPVLRRLSAEQFSDAVSQVISPLYKAVEYNPNGEKINAQRVWHKEMSVNRVVLPEPGKRYFRKSFNLSKIDIRSAKVLISVDHSYQLYLNGKKISEADDWTKVNKLDVSSYLKLGQNTIAIKGENEGTIGNPAGVLFSMQIIFQSGEKLYINSDESWKSTDQLPNKTWVTNQFDDKSWNLVKNYGTQNWGHLINFTFKNKEGTFARASLVKQHPFMKALGRPSREIVTTSREEQATLLQALELTNGAFFNRTLEVGAQEWIDNYGHNSKKIIEELYLRALGRNPTKEEKNMLMNALGDHPQKEQLQDVFWAILMSPEFQFIY